MPAAGRAASAASQGQESHPWWLGLASGLVVNRGQCGPAGCLGSSAGFAHNLATGAAYIELLAVLCGVLAIRAAASCKLTSSLSAKHLP